MKKCLLIVTCLILVSCGPERYDSVWEPMRYDATTLQIAESDCRTMADKRYTDAMIGSGEHKADHLNYKDKVYTDCMMEHGWIARATNYNKI